MDYNANITPAKLTMNGSNSNTPRSSLNTPGSSRKRTKGNMFQAFDTACKGISSRADLINKQEIYTNIKSNDGFAVFINQVNSYYGTSERGKIAKDKFITQTFDKFIGKFTADSDEGIKLKEVRNKLDVAASITSSVSASPTTFVGVFQSKGLSNLPTPPKAGSPFPTVEGIPRIVGTPTSSQTRKVVAVTSVSRSKAVPVQAVIASSNPTISNVGSTSRKQAVPALIKPPTPPTALETFREQYDESDKSDHKKLELIKIILGNDQGVGFIQNLIDEPDYLSNYFYDILEEYFTEEILLTEAAGGLETFVDVLFKRDPEVKSDLAQAVIVSPAAGSPDIGMDQVYSTPSSDVNGSPPTRPRRNETATSRPNVNHADSSRAFNTPLQPKGNYSASHDDDPNVIADQAYFLDGHNPQARNLVSNGPFITPKQAGSSRKIEDSINLKELFSTDLGGVIAAIADLKVNESSYDIVKFCQEINKLNDIFLVKTCCDRIDDSTKLEAKLADMKSKLTNATTCDVIDAYGSYRAEKVGPEASVQAAASHTLWGEKVATGVNNSAATLGNK